MTNQVEMFGDGPSKKLTKLKLAEGGAPLWTAEKASLIDEYIHRFLLVTKHGVYLDLFAGPQRADDLESWSVRRVLVRRTEGSPSVRHYAVCDEDPAQVERLREFGIIMTNAWPEQSSETVQAIVEGVSSMQQRDCALSRPAAPPG